MKRLPICLAYIVKNEGEFLRASVESAIDWISQLVFLDSGSTDETEVIAKSFETSAPDFLWTSAKWENDFSKARNRAASFSKQPWILFLDGDEVLDPDAYLKISDAISQDAISCFSFIQRNYTRNSGLEGGKRADGIIPGLSQSHDPYFYLDNWMERLYQSNRGLKYEGRIHESLAPSCERLNLRRAQLPVILHHFGRLKATTTKKLEYYLELAEQKWKEDAEHPVSWIELATNLLELGRTDQAFQLSEAAIKKFPNNPEVLRMGFQAALRAEHFDIAEIWIHSFLKLNPNDLYAKAQLTTALLYQKKFDDVLRLATEIFQTDPNNFVVHLNCGVIDFEIKNWNSALRHLEIAQRERPHDQFVASALEKIRSHLQIH